MVKFDVRFCKCGRIHFIENSLIDDALEQDKNLMFVCGGCGSVLLIGADREADWNDPSKTIFNMYTFEKSEELQIWDESLFAGSDKKKAVSKIFYSQGVQVMMMTGYYAKSFEHGIGRFQDIWYPDFWKIPKNATAEDYKAFIEQWQKDSVTVNMSYLLRTLTDEQAKALSGYFVEGLDWKGTKYEREWHK